MIGRFIFFDVRESSRSKTVLPSLETGYYLYLFDKRGDYHILETDFYEDFSNKCMEIKRVINKQLSEQLFEHIEKTLNNRTWLNDSVWVDRRCIYE